MATLPKILVQNAWISVNAVNSVSVGTEMLLQNTSDEEELLVCESSTQPTDLTKSITLYPKTSINVVSGSLEIWVRTATEYDKISLSVQT